MEELEQVFSVLPRFYIPWFECDLNGLAGIERIDETVLQGEDLFCIREIRGKEEYEKTEEGYLLTLFLPCVEKEELFLQESETDIILKIGNMKRNIPRPSTLRSYEICSAKLEEGYLKILFVKREDEDGC